MRGAPPAGAPPVIAPPAGKPAAVKLSLRLRYRRAGGCSRRAAVLTLAGTGLDRVLRAGLTFRSRKLATRPLPALQAHRDQAAPARTPARARVRSGSGCAAAGS